MSSPAKISAGRLMFRSREGNTVKQISACATIQKTKLIVIYARRSSMGKYARRSYHTILERTTRQNVHNTIFAKRAFILWSLYCQPLHGVYKSHGGLTGASRRRGQTLRCSSSVLQTLHNCGNAPSFGLFAALHCPRTIGLSYNLEQ